VLARRRGLAAGLVAVAWLALALAVLTAYVDHVAVNSDQFANRATVVLGNPAAKRLIAGEITGQVLERVPHLVALQPLVRAAVSAVVASSAFTGLFRAGVEAAHATLVSGSASRLTLSIGNVGTVVASALALVDPSAARALRSTQQIVLLSRNVGSLTATIARGAGVISWLWAVLAALFLVCAAAAVAVSRPRGAALRRLGVGVAGVGVLLFVGLLAGRAIAVGQVHGADAKATVGAVWDAFLGGLRTVSLALAVAGVVAALVGTLRSGHATVRVRRKL
jgi:hypothetical protein